LISLIVKIGVPVSKLVEEVVAEKLIIFFSNYDLFR